MSETYHLEIDKLLALATNPQNRNLIVKVMDNLIINYAKTMHKDDKENQKDGGKDNVKKNH